MTDDDNTNDSNQPKRPNVNYNLSRPDAGKDPSSGELVFHYNRERRLAKAPQSVKDLYASEKKRKGFSLIRPLVETKSKAFTFFTILAICVIIILVSILGNLDSSYLLEGNSLEIRGTRFEDIVILTIKKTVKNNTAFFGAVDLGVSPVTADEDYPVFYQRIYFNPDPYEEFRFSVPFDALELALVIQTEQSGLRIRLKTD